MIEDISIIASYENKTQSTCAIDITPLKTNKRMNEWINELMNELINQWKQL